MNLSFRAEFVDCSDALGGDLLQIDFDTMPSDINPDDRNSPYVIISRLFEFPGPATIEWHDGSDYDGGAKILSLRLSRSELLLQLDRGRKIAISFDIPDPKYRILNSFLQRMVGRGKCTCEALPEPSDPGNHEGRGR